MSSVSYSSELLNLKGVPRILWIWSQWVRCASGPESPNIQLLSHVRAVLLGTMSLNLRCRMLTLDD